MYQSKTGIFSWKLTVTHGPGSFHLVAHSSASESFLPLSDRKRSGKLYAFLKIPAVRYFVVMWSHDARGAGKHSPVWGSHLPVTAPNCGGGSLNL